jgi:hypothetical protein
LSQPSAPHFSQTFAPIGEHDHAKDGENGVVFCVGQIERLSIHDAGFDIG